MKEQIGFLYVEETKFGPRKYGISFQVWASPQSSIDSLVEHMARQKNLPESLKLMPLNKECRYSNLNGYSVLRPFDKEETDYMRARLKELGVKASVRPNRGERRNEKI